MPCLVFVGNKDERISLCKVGMQHFRDEGGERTSRKSVDDEGKGAIRKKNALERTLCLVKFPIETNGFKNGLQVGLPFVFWFLFIWNRAS